MHNIEKLKPVFKSPGFVLFILFTTLLPQFTERLPASYFKYFYLSLFCLFIPLSSLGYWKKKLPLVLIILSVSFLHFYLGSSVELIAKNILYGGMIFFLYDQFLVIANIHVVRRLVVVFAVILASIGLFQEWLYLIGSDYFYMSLYKFPDFLYHRKIFRIASLATEPSQLAMYLLPAFYIGLGALLTNSKRYMKTWEFIVVSLALALTFSVVGYLGVILGVGYFAFVFKKLNLKVYLGLGMTLVLLIWGLLNTAIVKDKLNATRLFGTQTKVNSSVEGSSIYAYTGAKAIQKSFESLNLIGTGVGLYSSFVKSIWDEIGYENRNDDGTNLGHARVVVEFGLLIYLLFWGWILKNFLFRSDDTSLKIFNNSFLLFIIVALIRIGFYYHPFLLFSFAMINKKEKSLS